MSQIAHIKEVKRAIIARHINPDNITGFSQVLTTLLPIAALWYGVVLSASVSYWLTAGVTLALSLYLIRVFLMMHECGHGTLFRTAWLNKSFGFVFGVLSGIPQYVWSQHHHYHHSTNGNWAKYRGPLSIITLDDYAAMSARQQRQYRSARNIWLTPFAGFMYLLFNPRYTWLKGSVSLLRHLIGRKIAQPGISIKAHALEFKTPYWSSAQEYWQIFWNNVVLLSLWGVMAWWIGSALFFVCYTVSVSLSGAASILLFAVQHNFDHSYASEDEGWDYDTAAIEGTSFLDLPRWLNWLTMNIAYHHVHHLSARIPNYCLVQCHNENEQLFADVARIKLSQVPRAFKCILWDVRARCVISVAEYQRQTSAP